MKQLMFSLQRRLALTYALFISLALALLTVIVNVFTGFVFTALVKENIVEKSLEIVRASVYPHGLWHGLPLGKGTVKR